MQFKEAARDFLDYIEMTRSNGTYRYQASKIKPLVKYYEDTDIDTIDKKSFIRLITYLRRKNESVSTTTINKYMGTLKRIIKYNTDKEIEFEKLPEQKKIIPILSERVINLVFNYYQKNLYRKEMLRNYTLFRLLLDSGLRIGEALNIKITDIDFDQNTIHVKVTKTNRERYVFFTKTTKNLIKKLIADDVLRDLLFINYVGNKMLTADNILKICYRLQDKLDIKDGIRPHKWRHTFATNFLKKGGDLETLRLIMGHSTLATTQIYLHMNKEDLNREYFRLYA